MPNILTANDSGWASNWRTSVGQGTYSKYIRYAECPEKPAAVRDCLVNSDHTWREATAEEIAERDYVAPRTQSDAEAQYQSLCESLGFEGKPGTTALDTAIATLAETDLKTATLAIGRISAINNELVNRMGIPWEDWIWD